MSKYKGLQVQTPNSQFVLKDQLSEGGYSFVYSTNNPQVLCKVQLISMAPIEKGYANEKYILGTLQHKNIIKMHASAEVIYKNDRLGLLFLQNCSKGYHKHQLSNLINLLERLKHQDVEQRQVIKIMLHVLCALELLHVNGVAHRDVKLENILEGSDGEFKLCDFGSASGQTITSITNSNRHLVQEDIQKHTTPLYRAPEQLDLYSGFQIGTKVDIFALGCAIFMLCFKKQPFQSRLSSINIQYFTPQSHIYSEFLIDLMKRCFIPNPKSRPSASQLISLITQKMKTTKTVQSSGQAIDIQHEYSVILNELQAVKSVEESNQVNVTVSDKLRKMFSQLTTKTEGWIIGFIEENEEAPMIKYNKYIIAKCWEKRYKVEKVYQVMMKESMNNVGKSLVVLKILILLHNFLRKGPPEAISNKFKINATTICLWLFKNWKSLNKSDKLIDKKRHPYVCGLILIYLVIIMDKLRLCFAYAFFIEGNYSLMPFFKLGIDAKILSLSFIDELMTFLEKVISFHECVQAHSYVIDIQRSIVLSLIDEQYCLFSTLVHIMIAFKQGTNYLEQDIDRKALKTQVSDRESRIELLFNRLQKLFETAKKFSTLFEENTFSLNRQVIDLIRNTPILQNRKNFNIKQYLNYNNSYFGLKIPMTYHEVAKNTQQLEDNKFSAESSAYIETDPFKKQKQVRFEELEFENLKKIEARNPFDSLVPNMMEFTHQNLNKDFAVKTQKENFQQDKHKEFLSFASVTQTPKEIDFSHFEDAAMEKQIESVRPAVQQKIRQKAQNFIDLKGFIMDEVAKSAIQYIIPYGELQFTKQIGNGHSSEVYLGRWRGQEVAIKKITNKKSHHEFIRQIVTSIKMRPHCNLVTLIGVAENTQLYIISQYCHGGTLFSLLHESKCLISWQTKIEMARQIAQGMLYLHTNSPPIIHRDLKSLKQLIHYVSILISYPYRVPSDRLQLKIADFGLSREMSKSFMTGVLGTFHWMAPEIFNNQKYSTQADVFSYGIVLWEIMTRQTPYKNIDNPQALMKYVTMEQGRPDVRLISSQCPLAFKALMIQCWDQDPSKRPTFKLIIDRLNAIQI